MATHAAIYTRVMGDGPASEENRSSIQVMKCKEFCRKNAWITSEATTFIETIPSVGSDGGRPVFEQMMKQAQANPPAFSVIVVLDMDRFMRDRDLRDITKEKLLVNRVKVISVKDGSRVF
jgi:DNA invertase Pin-like site-specific DNA recombinase